MPYYNIKKDQDREICKRVTKGAFRLRAYFRLDRNVSGKALLSPYAKKGFTCL